MVLLLVVWLWMVFGFWADLGCGVGFFGFLLPFFKRT
jgi:hypothetical protein